MAGFLAAAVTAAAGGCGGSALDAQTAAIANSAVSGQGSVQAAGAAAGDSLPGGASGAGSPSESTDASGATGGTGETDGTTTSGSTGDGSGGPGTSGAGVGSGGSAATGSGTTAAGDAGAARSRLRASSCTGFTNQTGITDSTLSIGNAADISGPIPGLFKGAQDGVKAYVAYFNATHPQGICGRKLVLDSYDSRTDAGADQQAYTTMCAKDFAAVGSLSVYDDGGVPPAEKCGLADLNAIALSTARNRCRVCFAAEPAGDKEGINAVPDFLLEHTHDATQKAAIVWLNTGAAAEKAQQYLELNQRRGWKYVYSAAIDVSEFNYGPFVQQMKSKGAELVQLVGAYQQTVRLAQAMQSADYKPDVFLSDVSVYDPAFAQSGGDAVDGVIIPINFTPFEESQPELNTYKQWLQQSNPGAAPSYFGMYAWSAAKLFTESALELGGKLARSSLLAKLATVHRWDGGGMHAAMDVGGKNAPPCVRFIQLHGNTWRPFDGTTYTCKGLSTVS